MFKMASFLCYGILFSLLLSGCGVTGAMHATFCRICDSEDPSVGDDCSCATNTTCINDWWLSTRPNDECKTTNLMPQSASWPSLGTRCSFCCRATTISSPYCNDGDFPAPSDLVTFDVTASTVAPTVTTQQTSTQKSTASTSLSSPSSATTTQTATATSAPLQSMKCSQCVLTRASPTCQAPPIMCSGTTPLCMTSFYDDATGNPLAVKRCASIDMCKTLWWDTTRLEGRCMGDIDHDPFSWAGHTPGECHYCCLTKDSSSNYWCNKPHWPTRPSHTVNMTEFINGISMTTSTLKPTTQSTLSTLISSQVFNTSPPSTSPDNLSTTITTTITSTVQANTSLSSSPILLLNNTSAISPTPGSTVAAQTTVAMSGTLCEECEENPQTGVSCQCSSTHLCPASKPYCMNTLTFSLQHGLSTFVEKRCSDEVQCKNNSQINSLCYGDLTDPNVIYPGLVCRLVT